MNAADQYPIVPLRCACHFFERCSIASAVLIAFFLPLSTALSHLFFVLTCCFLLAGNFRCDIKKITCCPVVLPFLLFFGLLLVGSTYTSASLDEVGRIVGKYGKLLYLLVLLPLFSRQKSSRLAVMAFASAGLLTILLSQLAHWKLFSHCKYGELMAKYPFKNRIDTGFILGLSAYFFLLESLRQKKTTTLWCCRFLSLLSIVHVYCFTTGRTGYGITAMVVLFALYCCWQRKKSVRWICLLIVAIALPLFVFSFNLSARLTDTWYEWSQSQTRETSLGTRMECARIGWQTFLRSPFWGEGTGSVKSELQEKMPSFYSPIDGTDNEYINVMMQWGSVGLFLLIALFYCPWRASRHLENHDRLLIRGIILSIAVGSLANSWLMDSLQGYAYVYFLALAFGPYFSKKWREKKALN